MVLWGESNLLITRLRFLSSTESRLYDGDPRQPDKSVLWLNNFSDEMHAFNLYNAQGYKLHPQINIKKDRIEIDRKDLLAGVYLFELYAEKNIIINGKFILE